MNITAPRACNWPWSTGPIVYNFIFADLGIHRYAMEPEKLNALSNTLHDLEVRAADLRRYL